MKILSLISRVLVGALFIVSGLIKANDPLGFSYKLVEYFTEDVLGFTWLADYVLPLAVLICVAEIVLGIFNKGYIKDKVVFWKERDSHNILDVASLSKAMVNMAATKTGALIILSGETDLKLYSNAIDLIDAKLTSGMIESIFYKNSPLHDGAVIIEDNRLIAARAVLPASNREDLPAELGMRHRAALGITEVSDAIALIVSEQTGNISYTKKGRLTQDVTIEEMQAFLKRHFN